MKKTLLVTVIVMFFIVIAVGHAQSFDPWADVRNSIDRLNEMTAAWTTTINITGLTTHIGKQIYCQLINQQAAEVAYAWVTVNSRGIASFNMLDVVTERNWQDIGYFMAELYIDGEWYYYNDGTMPNNRSTAIAFAGELGSRIVSLGFTRFIKTSGMVGSPNQGNATDNRPTITIVNRTGYTIWYVYVSSSTSNNWGDDILYSDQVLTNGQSINVILGQPLNVTNRYDIRIIDLDGDSYTKWNVLVSNNATITFTFDDFD